MNPAKLGLLWVGMGGLLLSPSLAQPWPPPTFPGARSILWVGAHPDDEVIAAPLLARLCRDEHLRCSFLVFTRGEKGVCRLPRGCRPNLAAVRAAEMERAARLYGARLTQWSYADGGGGPQGSAPSWEAVAGGRTALVRSLASTINAGAPDLVLTFDPRHGSTCHPDHRAVGSLVVEALATIERGPALYLLESRVSLLESPLRFSIVPAASFKAGALGFDGNLAAPGRSTGWQTLLEDASQHRSQFDPPRLAALAAVPSRQRTAFAGPASLLLASEDVSTCE